MRSVLFVLFSLGFIGCGGSTQQAKAVAPVPEPEPVVEEEPPPTPTYVIVHRNSPIRLRPDDDAPFLQYRTDERQQELEKKWAEEYKEADEKWLESHEEWWENEKKRRQKLRKRLRKFRPKKRAEVRERDLEQQDARVDAHYVERLNQLRKRARRRSLEASHRAWIPFRLIKRKGPWLEVSPADRTAQPPHCYEGNFGRLDRLEAKFYVHEDDVAPVTTRSVSVEPMEGTKVTLKPGVALRRTTGGYKVYVGAFELELDLPTDAIGTEYEPDSPFESPVTNMVFTPYSLARDRLRLGPGQALSYNPYRQLYVTGTVGVGSRFYATTQTPCGEYTVRLNKDYIEPAGKRGVMRLSGDDSAVSAPYARAGAMAHLPDGEPFARARADFPLGKEVKDSGGRACYQAAAWGKGNAKHRSLELCFESTDVVLD